MVCISITQHQPAQPLISLSLLLADSAIFSSGGRDWAVLYVSQ